MKKIYAEKLLDIIFAFYVFAVNLNTYAIIFYIPTLLLLLLLLNGLYRTLIALGLYRTWTKYLNSLQITSCIVCSRARPLLQCRQIRG
jgi:hypothetical protein